MFHRSLSTALAASLFVCAGSAGAQWDQWGGLDRNFRAESTNLLTEWPEEGPKKIWTRELGDGYSCILADGKTLYTMYRNGEKEAIVALDTDTGKTKWEHGYAAPHREGATLRFGHGPNATPLIVGDRLFSAGINAAVTCLDKNDGKKIWSQDLAKLFEGTFMRFGYSSSPIAYKDMIYVQLGGDGNSLVALKMSDGSVVWKKQSYANSYASPIVINVDGQDQLVAFMDTHLIGTDPVTGESLWEFLHNQNQQGGGMSSPLWGKKDNLLYLSSGAGSRMLKLAQLDGKTDVEELWINRRVKVSHTNVVRVDDTLYATAPTMFMAFDANNGSLVFRKRGFVKTNIVAADGKLLMLDEDGNLILATPGENLEIHAKVKILDNPSWTAPTLVGNRLYVRDKTTIASYELPTQS